MRKSDILEWLPLGILDRIPFPISIHSPEFEVLYANRKFRELFGEEVLGRRCYEVVHGTSGPVPECPHVKTLSSGETFQEVLYEKTHGMYFEVITVPFRAGDSVLTLHIIIDATGAKVAEVELSRERNLLKSILEVLGALVVVLDREGRIVLFNRACEELTGYAEREVRGRPIFDLLIPEEEREGVKRVFMNLKGAELPSEYENHWVTKNGERRLISWRNTVIADENGEVSLIIGTGIDVTRQRKNEKAIEEELRKRAAINEITLSLLSAQSTSGIYSTLLHHLHGLLGGELIFIAAVEEGGTLKVVASSGPEEDLRALKDAELNLAHYSVLTGLSMGQTVLVEDLSRLQCISETCSHLKDAGYRSMLAAPLLVEGELVGAIFMLSKEGHRALEKNVTLLTDLLPTASLVLRLHRLLDMVEGLNSDLQAAYSTLKVITKTMRHDILNQTTVLRGYLDLYTSKKDPRYLNKMKATLERIENLIEDMRNLESLAERGEGLKAMRISEVLKEIRGMYSVEISLEGDCEVLADEGITSLFQNLVHNSIIHGGATRVEVIVRPGDDGICEVKVRDNGKGIPEEIRERVFDEGFSYGERRGTGLGLYLVKKAVERYGGEIELADEPGGGATFIIRLKKAEGGYQHS